MQLSWRTLLPACLSVCLVHSTSLYANTPHQGFSSSEHLSIGNDVNIRLAANDSGKVGATLHLPNGLQLTYGEIIATGDFYEIVGQPIALGQSDAEQRSRFLAAVSSFTLNPAVIPEITKIFEVIHEEEKALADGMKNGEKPEDILKKFGQDSDRRFNCITGGGCNASTWWLEPGRYLDLAKQDFDHFGDNAWFAYAIGHQVALEEAAAAHQNNDVGMLELAYAMNAFATHFLSDRFAAGHLRTPRMELTEHVTPGTIGSLLSSYMHAEENAYGLHVHNARGDHWLAYGDRSYFSSKSAEHRRLIAEAVQASADQIFAAYQQGSSQVTDTVASIIPIADEIADGSIQDLSPLFYWDSKTNTMMRREVMADPFNRHWTASWWGWSTLIELKRERGLADDLQAQLVLSPLKEQAIRAGLITNKNFINYKK